MAIRDEYIAVLRQELGAGFESAILSTLMREYVARELKPKVLAARRAALDTTALIAARVAKEQALADEITARKAAEDALAAQLEIDLGGF